MAYELKDGQGSLFTNERKEKETHPDWQGSIKIEGKEYWLSGWEKDGAKGKFFSLSAKEKKADFAGLKKEIQEQSANKIDDADDIPF